VGRVYLDISVSLDGFVAGPSPTLEEPLGKRGEELHEWIVALESWRERHGMSGGETGPENDLLAGSVADQGAVVMGRKMFSGGRGPWEDDPKADGWWGDEPPFQTPVFVVTHHARDPVVKANGTSYAFVTDGVESAIEQARVAAGEKGVLVAGGADIAQQALRSGQLDELQLHVSPVLLGAGTRLFDNLDAADIRLEPTRVVDAPAATHLYYRVRS
jgi:dihydrofolate reductase